MKNYVEKLLFLLLSTGLILSICAFEHPKMSPYFFPLGLILSGTAGCIWNWCREPDFTYGFLASAVSVIAGILVAILLSVAIL